jgi:uncharacterized damage-inducible protein DinB
MSETLTPLAVSIADPGDPIVARALWILMEARRRTLRALSGLPDTALEWAPPTETHTIGTLLYHIAATEMEWICLDLLGGRSVAGALAPLFDRGVREVDGRLVPIRGETVGAHLQRLAMMRAFTLDALGSTDDRAFCRPRPMALEARTVTPEWLVYHLAQHEAEHRGQIIQLRRAWEREDSARQAAR